MRRRVPLLVAALLGVPLLAGCGSSGLGTGNDFTVESALRTLPDVDEDGVPDGEGTRVVVGDLGTLRGDAAAHPGEDPARWIGRLDDVGIASLLPTTLAAEQLGTGQVRRTLGFDARDVVSFAGLESAPARLSVLRLADGSGVEDGVKATSSGEPGDRATGSIATTFPVVLGLGQRNGEVALGQTAEVLVDWADKGSTMGDEDDLAAVARALDDENVVAAALVDGDVQPPRGSRAPAAGLVPDYDAVGVGQSLGDEKGEVTTWAAYRTDEPGRLAAAVRRAWEDGSSLTTGEPLSDLARLEDVSTDGDTVLVELDPRRPDGVLRLLQRDDAPFAVDPGQDD